jgi:hypothetical protein
MIAEKERGPMRIGYLIFHLKNQNEVTLPPNTELLKLKRGCGRQEDFRC